MRQSTILSGVDDSNKAYDLGATSFLTKPGPTSANSAMPCWPCTTLANQSARPEFTRVQRNLAPKREKPDRQLRPELPHKRPDSNLARHAARRGGDCEYFCQLV